jgi:very-short-patch-repair endonuclease
MKPSKLPPNDIFTAICGKNNGVECVKEHLFHPTRKWRFDYAIPSHKIAIEVDGGVWVNGRHNRPAGYLKDLDKFNAAASMGWLVLKFTPDELLKSATLDLIRETIKNR